MKNVEEKLIIQLSPFNIMVNGVPVARDFKGFKVYCKKFGFTEDQFEFWPFTHRLDGSIVKGN